MTGPSWADNNFLMQCINLGDWENRVSSLSVERTAHDYAIGRWMGLTATEGFTFEYNVGFKTAKTTEVTKSSTYTLAYELSFGVKFFGSSFQNTLSAGYQHEVTNDATSSMEKDVSVKWPITCSDKSGEGGVGLWQFFVESHDGMDTTLTGHTVCRYGADYNKSPDCPWDACLDASCTKCTTDWHD